MPRKSGRLKVRIVHEVQPSLFLKVPIVHEKREAVRGKVVVTRDAGPWWGNVGPGMEPPQIRAARVQEVLQDLLRIRTRYAILREFDSVWAGIDAAVATKTQKKRRRRSRAINDDENDLEKLEARTGKIARLSKKGACASAQPPIPRL